MRITANMVTIARIVLMPLPVYLLYREQTSLMVALSCIIVLGLTDLLDGWMARREGPTVLGGLLDPIADKIFVAVVYLPLTERGMVPLWMTAAILVRESLVTTLRTAMSLRDAPMRTATIAKYKTAIQMIAAGYVILFLASPHPAIVYSLIAGVILLPLGLIVWRTLRGKKQGPRSWTFLGLTFVGLSAVWFLGQDRFLVGVFVLVTGITLWSGFSYLVDARQEFKGKPGGIKETIRSLLDGVLVPLTVVSLIGRVGAPWTSAALLVIISCELATGGLGNLIASRHLVPRFRWMALKSALELALCGLALAGALELVAVPVAGQAAALFAACGVSVLFAILAFVRQRHVYLGQLG